MKNLYIILIAMLSVISCSSPKIHIPSYYESRYVYYGEEQADATLYTIKEAGKLAEQYPEESVLNDEIKITVNFSRNEDYDSTAFDKLAETARINKAKKEKEELKKQEEFKKSLEKIMKGDFSDITILFGSDDDDDLTDNPIPDGEVYANTRYEYEYTTLKDFVNKPFVVSYNSMTSAKNFSFKIDDHVAELEKNTEKYEGGDYFKTDSRYLYYDLSLPVRGTRVNAKYSEKCRDAKFKSMIYIQEDHFTEKKIIKIAKPDWLDFEIIEKNFQGIEFKKEEIEEIDKSKDDEEAEDKDDEKVSEQKNKTAAQIKKDKAKAKTKAKASKVKTKYIVYTFKNLKPYQKYKSGRGSSYNLPMLYFHYKTVTTAKGTKTLFKSTDDMYKWYRLVTGTLQNDTAKFATFTKNLVKGLKTDEEKIKKVYYWIQDNVKYVAFEDGVAGFRPDECGNVFSKKYGDCKGMANLSKNMLRVLGYDAHMVWIGTRHLNFSYDQPGLPVDNHAICAVKLNGKFVFLDATEKYCSYGDYANRIQGRKCIVENGPSYMVETIPEFGPEHNEDLTTEVMDLTGTTINVKGKKTFKGESKIDFLRYYNLMRSQNKNEALFNYLTDQQLSIDAKNISSSDLTNRDIDAELKYELTVDNHAFIKDGKTYINLDWTRYFSGYNFDSTRVIDYSFDSKIDLKRNVVFNLKPGQKVGKLPAPVNIDNPYYNFVLEIKQVGNTLVYKRSLVTKQDYVPVSMLKKLNEDSRQLATFYNNFIELK